MSDNITPREVPGAFPSADPLTLMTNEFLMMDIPAINIEGAVDDFKVLQCRPHISHLNLSFQSRISFQRLEMNTNILGKTSF